MIQIVTKKKGCQKELQGNPQGFVILHNEMLRVSAYSRGRRVNGPPIAGNIKNYKKDKEQGKKTQMDPLFRHIDQELYGVSPARSK